MRNGGDDESYWLCVHYVGICPAYNATRVSIRSILRLLVHGIRFTDRIYGMAYPSWLLRQAINQGIPQITGAFYSTEGCDARGAIQLVSQRKQQPELSWGDLSDDPPAILENFNYWQRVANPFTYDELTKMPRLYRNLFALQRGSFELVLVAANDYLGLSFMDIYYLIRRMGVEQ